MEEQSFALFDSMQNESSTEISIDDIADLNVTRRLPKGTKACYVGMADLPTRGAFPTGWSYEEYSGGMKFVNGDTIVARITPCLENGKTAFVNFLEDGDIGFGSTEYIVLTPKEGIPAPFLYCLARNDAFRDYAIKNMNGSSGRQRVTATTIGQYKLMLPDTEALNKFAVMAESMYAQIGRNGFENRRLATVRDALLPRLMSGELDVSNIEI